MKTDIEKMIDAIQNKDMIKAKDHLLKALMRKCERKMRDVLDKEDK